MQPAPAPALSSPEAFEIDEKNKEAIAGMTHDDILNAQAEISSTLPPNAVEFLRKRLQTKKAQAAGAAARGPPARKPLPGQPGSALYAAQKACEEANRKLLEDAAAASAKSSRRAKRAGAAADAASSPSTATPRSTRVGSVARPDPEAESAVEATRHEDVARGEGRRVFDDADLCARRARGASSGDGPAKRAADDITSSRSTNAFPREGGECQVARVRL